MAQHLCKSPLEKDPLQLLVIRSDAKSGQMWSRTACSIIYQSPKTRNPFRPQETKCKQSLIFTINCPRISREILRKNHEKPGSGEHFCILQRTRTVCFGHQALLNCIALLSHEMSLSLKFEYMFGGCWCFQAILGRCFTLEINENMWWITRMKASNRVVKWRVICFWMRWTDTEINRNSLQPHDFSLCSATWTIGRIPDTIPQWSTDP